MVLELPVPVSKEEKVQFLLQNRIALWDVVKSCEIAGADDTSIRNAIPNDILSLVRTAEIKAIFTTGTKAAALYQRLCYPKTKISAIALPSTSPANCRWYTMERLVQAYQVIRPYLKEKEAIPTKIF